ncbi:hypothetical protein [Brachyspira intermedia]|uniref:hypothetical protein n=1 Tax=Brachyspira intermedia TaxID=84377 RepID=UPI00300549B5
MKRRGEVNIGMANYLYKNSNNIVKNINSNLNSEDINHIIIGRLYYGVYLIAKDYLINNCNYVSKCIKRNTCDFYKNNICDLECLKHKTYINVKKNKHKPSLWEELANNINQFPINENKNTIQTYGENFAELRESYEYHPTYCNRSRVVKANNFYSRILGVLNVK